MGVAACCTQKEKSALGVNAQPKVLKGSLLNNKLATGYKTKMLSFDNTQVSTLEKKFVIDKLRVMHFVNC